MVAEDERGKWVQTGREKRYVDVVARWHADGYVEPLVVCWPDGRSFDICEVVGRPQSSKVPGAEGRTLRYSVLVETLGGRKPAKLFLEHGQGESRDEARWYVERNTSAALWRFRCSFASR